MFSKNEDQFMSSLRPQSVEFHEKKGHFWTIEIPSHIQEHLQHDESNMNAQIIYPFCDKMKTNLFREQYQQAYIDVFKAIEQEMITHSAYISVGILDMKSNNPILGIDNYSMTQDIIDAFIQCTPKIHKLIFISEVESQAFIMGMALKDKTRHLQDLTNVFVEQDKQKPDEPEQANQADQIIEQQEIPIRVELEIQFKQDEDIQLNSNNVQSQIQKLNSQVQRIQKPTVVSYHNGHKCIDDLIYMIRKHCLLILQRIQCSFELIKWVIQVQCVCVVETSRSESKVIYVVIAECIDPLYYNANNEQDCQQFRHVEDSIVPVVLILLNFLMCVFKAIK
ncbi:unnamed protein product (macronuclear) [Paramecium tetraurelia]|uniref:CRAL-TRIO domain-containing protein n=1 Tax=Paramecium tetraurelia TaxID=5888 RepID=A0BTM1_PARTE|nr:uncharacterized protein GSPATT00032120001 [Paramecium tetraurelia]CAK61888.1 unnamed protein product [Paramecium tetraurelia]|eukprot:XP_001429286.1 hypothetical protein (macronuclear) [Paramecium tetraurelia strain d4-2]